MAPTQQNPATGVPSALAAAPPPHRPMKMPEPAGPLAGIGISGTVNRYGRVYNDPNPKLAWGTDAMGLPSGNSWGEWETLAKMDNACAAALVSTIGPLRDAKVELTPPDDSDASKLIADVVRDNLLKWMSPRWPEYLQQAVWWSLACGFALHEPVMGVRKDKRLPNGQGYFVKELQQRLPSSIHPNGWNEEGTGDLVWIRQQGLQKDGSWGADIRLPAKNVLLLTWARDGNNYPGVSAFRSAWYIGQIRDALLHMVGIGNQREALGMPFAEIDLEAKLSKQQLDDLETLLQNLTYHENANAVLPPGVTINWNLSAKADKGYVLEQWTKLGEVILQLVQAQAMTVGTGKTGSFASGKIQQSSGQAFVQSVKANLEAMLNGVGEQVYTGLIARVVRPNFGPDVELPQLTLTLQQESLAPADFATGLKTLADGGIITVTCEVENTAREKFGLEPISEKERDAAAQKKLEDAQAMMVSAPGSSPDSAVPKKGPPSPLSKAPAGKAPSKPAGFSEKPAKASRHLTASAALPFTPSRPLAPHEEHLDVQGMNDFHTAARMEFERDVKLILGDMARALKPAIAKALADNRPDELANLTPPGGLLSKAVELFIEKARATGHRTAAKEKKAQPAGLLAKRRRGISGVKPTPLMAAVRLRLARSRFARLYRAAAEEDDLNAPADTGESPDEVPTDRLVKAQTSLLTTRIRNRLKAQLQDEAIDVARRGGTADDVVDQVLGDIEDSKALRTDAGTVLARSFSMGREQFFAEHADDLSHMVYSAVLDGNVCDPCAALDGEEFEPDDPSYDDAIPPLKDCDGGGNCRCLMVAVYAAQADEGDAEEGD